MKSIEFAFDGPQSRRHTGERIENGLLYMSDKPGWVLIRSRPDDYSAVIISYERSHPEKSSLSRRAFVESLCGGLGAVGLTGMLADDLGAATVPTGPHFVPTAKNIIFLFMPGGPSHVDLLDPKPALLKYEGQRPDDVNLRTERLTGGLLPSPFEFKRHGQSGIEVSELLPNLAGIVDELCVIRSMHTFNPTHGPARNLIHTGNIAATRPTLGAWVSYGLGSENKNLPGFVVLSNSSSGGLFRRSGFLPAEHQGTHFNRAETDPEKMIRYLRNGKLDADAQRQQLDLLTALNQDHHASVGQDAFLEGRILAMETAYRMQFEAMDVFDVRQEPRKVREEYGSTDFANGCLLARRLVEKGVRYVHLFYGPANPGTTIRKSTRISVSVAPIWIREPLR